jgi:ribosomal protein S18 acetylase RimI-like enzyme
MYVAVAEVDGVPIGQRCLDLTTHAGERIGRVFGAWVVPEWQGRGIASMIDHHLEHVALARGFHAFRSSAAKHNAQAVRWHERLGDRVIGEGPARWTEPDGREVEVDVWTFERTLGCSCGDASGGRGDRAGPARRRPGPNARRRRR